MKYYSVPNRPEFLLTSDVDGALKYLQSNSKWQKDYHLRCSVLTRAALLMLLERPRLAALVCSEAGKAVGEALADVDEAIDFINYYARAEFRLQQKLQYKERGIFAVIAPWNFPLAIPCGMTVAALLAGNPVALKSAEQTPLVAQELVNLLHRAGVPETCLVHLPGYGDTGAALVQDKRVQGVVFTGSKKVGFQISAAMNRKAGNTRVITEMGGKKRLL